MINTLAGTFGRLYPLKSGCGSIANSKLFRWIDSLDTFDRLVSVKGGKAVVPSGDFVARALKYFGELDPKISWVVDRTLREGDTALDVGANLGSVTIHMASRVGESGRIEAFEPQPRLCELVRSSLKVNGYSQVVLNQTALGAKKSSMRLSVPFDNAGAATLNVRGNDEKESIDVPVDRLDNVVKSRRLKQIALVKIDVEGFESLVLEGASGLLASSPPHVILFEEHGNIHNQTPSSFQLLASYGYQIYALPKSIFKVWLEKVDFEKPPVANDYVAISPKAPQTIRDRLDI